MNRDIVGQLELNSEDCCLLGNVSNEVLNGFRVGDFELTTGTTRKRFQEVCEDLFQQPVSQLQLRDEEAVLLRDALAVTLEELGPSEFQTRTGSNYGYGQDLLKRLKQQSHASKDKTTHDEHRAYFTMIGDFIHSEISGQLDLNPTRAYSKGEAKPRTGIPHEASRWSLESRLDTQVSGSEHIRDVLDQLRPVKKIVRELRGNHDGWIQVVGYFASNAGFHIHAVDLQEMSEMNLGLDFDVYMLSEGNKRACQ